MHFSHTHKLWQRPWGLSEGVCILGALLCVGVLLQQLLPPLAIQFPTTAFVAFLLLACCIGVCIVAHDRVGVAFLYSSVALQTAALGFAATLALLSFMGIPPTQHYSFVLCYLYLLVVLLFHSTDAAMHIKTRWAFFCLHATVAIMLLFFAAAFRSEQTLRVRLQPQHTTNTLQTQTDPIPLPFTITLTRFDIDSHSGQYTSHLRITSLGEEEEVLLQVNKPYRFEDWTLTQMGYAPSASGYDSIVEFQYAPMQLPLRFALRAALVVALGIACSACRKQFLRRKKAKQHPYSEKILIS